MIIVVGSSCFLETSTTHLLSGDKTENSCVVVESGERQNIGDIDNVPTHPPHDSNYY
jgi:hypothetical protein